MAQAKFINQYGYFDRLLHRMAFAAPSIQISLADIEDQMYEKQLKALSVARPVFVTALPRAGTTMLLNLLYKTGEFATHTYRAMPFVMCPLLWSRISSQLAAKEVAEMERAHGDGISVSLDSPEAFEEMIWQHFWQPHYFEDHIKPWQRNYQNSEFVDFFRNHIKKLCLLAFPESDIRYLSKNNLNIARMAYICEIFPDATLIVPFREPVEHALSLHRQHMNFLEVHKEDKFAKDYMRGVGHFDFGLNFLPVDFDNWLGCDRREEALDPKFWLEYWIACYSYILNSRHENIQIVSFDRLTREPQSVLDKLATKLELRMPEKLVMQHNELRRPDKHSHGSQGFPKSLLAEAQNVWNTLSEVAL